MNELLLKKNKIGSNTFRLLFVSVEIAIRRTHAFGKIFVLSIPIKNKVFVFNKEKDEILLIDIKREIEESDIGFFFINDGIFTEPVQRNELLKQE